MRSLLLLVVLCCLSVPLAAQARFSAGIHVYTGLTGEFNYHNYDTGNSPFLWRQRHPLVTVGGLGGWVDYDIGGNLHLIVGLQYTNSGSTEIDEVYTDGPLFDRPVPFYARKNSFRLHQLQLPLTAHVFLGEGKMRPELLIGAQLSHNWMGRIYAESPSYIDEQGEPFAFSWGRNERTVHVFIPLNIQLVLGVGLRLNPQMRIELRQFWHDKDQSIVWSTEFSRPETQEDLDFMNTHSLWGGNTTSRYLSATVLQLSYRIW